MSDILIFDDAIPDPMAYRQRALELEYRTYDFHDATHTVIFHGIATGGPCAGMISRINYEFPKLKTTLTFFRKSPLGQVEPHFIHTDVDMGEWSALLYLNPKPKDGDGTSFWTHTPTGEVENPEPHLRSVEGREVDNWTLRQRVNAKFNRMVMFPSTYFHSRAIHENWGEGNDARLVQVAFGMGVPQ